MSLKVPSSIPTKLKYLVRIIKLIIIIIIIIIIMLIC